MWAAESTTLEHVRLKHSPVEALVARQRLSYLLSSVEFQPPSMPPAALLIVRSMLDPLPGRIAKKLEAGAIANGEWQQAARSQLTDFYRSAARPATNIVTPSAEAVVFADWGELLACYARDVVRGNTKAWWWRSVARRFSLRITASVADVWHDYPRYVPAALQLLSERGEAAGIVEHIPSPQAWRLLLSILRDSGLFRLASLVSECLQAQTASAQFEDGLSALTSSRQQAQPIGSVGPGLRTRHSEQLSQGVDVWQAGPDESGTAPPWEPYVPADAAGTGLGTAQRTLLGISLLLRRNLRHACSVTFSLQLKSWLMRTLGQERATFPKASATTASSPGPGLRDVVADQTDHSNRAAQTRGTGISLAGFAESEARLQAETADASGSPRAQITKSSSVCGAEYASSAISRTGFAEPEQGVDARGSVQAQITQNSSGCVAEDASSASAVALENGEFTGVAGAFYLIHFLRESGLFDFEVGLSGWALLELLTRCLLHSAWSAISDDAVWTALALLDGREPGTPPGAGFQPQATYEAPKSWLRGLNSSTQFVRFRSDRVETWHDEGFLTLDSNSAEKRAERVLRPVNRTQKRAWRKAAEVRAGGLCLSKQLRRFLHFALPYARWRLGAALRGTTPEEVLLRKGVLYVTRTHIDVEMSLNQIHLGARLAGLDSTPGWVPELGHVVTFHFR